MFSSGHSNPFQTSSTVSSSSLPPPPAAYEDFEFSSPFDFDFFAAQASLHSPPAPSASSSAAAAHHQRSPSSSSHPNHSQHPPIASTSFHSQQTYNSNPFSPQQFVTSPTPPTFASPIPSHSHIGGHSHSHSSNQFNSMSSVPGPRARETVFDASSPNSFPPRAPMSSFEPPQSAAPTQTPLFDDSESALLSSFLTTLDVDPYFLFNPVLPPGMPSPPNALPNDFEEDRKVRDHLGNAVGNLDLGHPSHRSTREWVDDHQDGRESEEDERDVEIGSSGKRSNSGQKSRAQNSNLNGKKVRRSTGLMKEGHDEDDSGSADVDMDDSSSSVAAVNGRASRSRRASRPGAGVSSTGARRPSGSNRNRDSSNSASPFASTSSSTAKHGSNPSGEISNLDPSAEQENNEEAIEGDEIEEDDDDDSGANKTLTDNQKRSNHIASEQKRRNAIRSGFKDLVDLLSAGETASGIVVAPPEPDPVDASGKKKRAVKGTGRGRGRKGEVAAGGSKSVVLEKAATYILWLERGNEGLAAEVKRVEASMRKLGISTS